MVCIRTYIKPVLGHKFLIFGVCHPGTLYFLEQRGERLWLFFEARRDPRAYKFEKHCIKAITI